MNFTAITVGIVLTAILSRLMGLWNGVCIALLLVLIMYLFWH